MQSVHLNVCEYEYICSSRYRLKGRTDINHNRQLKIYPSQICGEAKEAFQMSAKTQNRYCLENGNRR